MNSAVIIAAILFVLILLSFAKNRKKQEQQVEQHEDAAAVGSCHIRKLPDVADADGAAGAHQQKAQSGPETVTFIHKSVPPHNWLLADIFLENARTVSHYTRTAPFLTRKKDADLPRLFLSDVGCKEHEAKNASAAFEGSLVPV